MMVVLNSRMIYGIANDTVSGRLSPIVTPQRVFTSQLEAGVSVKNEQWSDPLQHPLQLEVEDFQMVSIAILQTLISILNFYQEDKQFRKERGGIASKRGSLISADVNLELHDELPPQ